MLSNVYFAIQLSSVARHGSKLMSYNSQVIHRLGTDTKEYFISFTMACNGILGFLMTCHGTDDKDLPCLNLLPLISL